MTRLARTSLMALGLSALMSPTALLADNLYKGGNWPSVAADEKASQIGDLVTVVIYEVASASNRVSTRTNKKTDIGGGLNAGGIDEEANLGFGGSYTGAGEVSRTEQFVARMSVKVMDVMPNGDFMIEGTQKLLINGENRNIVVRGRIRRTDIDSDNNIASSRIADAQINYDGKGFVSRSAKPGLVNRIFSFLGFS